MNRFYVLARKPSLAVRYYADQHVEQVFELMAGTVLNAQVRLIELYQVKKIEIEMRGGDVDSFSVRLRSLEELRRNGLVEVRESSSIMKWVLSTELIYAWTVDFIHEMINDLHRRSIGTQRFIQNHPLIRTFSRVSVDGLRPSALGLPRGEVFGNGPRAKVTTDLLVVQDREAYLKDFEHVPLSWAHGRPSFVNKRIRRGSTPLSPPPTGE